MATKKLSNSRAYKAGFAIVDTSLNGASAMFGAVGAVSSGTKNAVTGFFSGMAHAVTSRKATGATPVKKEAPRAKKPVAKKQATKKPVAKKPVAKKPVAAKRKAK